MLDFDLDDYKENTGGYAGPVNGGYVLKIMKVHDDPEKELLMCEMDIKGGKYDHYYEDLMHEHGFWAFKLYQSHKPKARGFFKHFVNNVARSNDGFEWTGDEKALEGKLVGGVCRLKEYIGNDGRTKCKLEVASTVPVSEINEGTYKKAKDRLLTDEMPEAADAGSFREIPDDDVPF